MQSGREEEMSAHPNLRVLVVDDDDGCTSALGELLAGAGREVRVTNSGTRALAECAHFEPQVVVIDLGLPDLDGFELARRLRAKGPEAPRLIAITGYRGAATAAAREAGFEDCLLKPIDVQRLLDVVTRPGVGIR
jgi:CheY-like chemotaxis protein